ncbi:MAG: DUF4328 domain-containing protein [Myxococcales bacterium]|nr:DUF4328 domain-containing protein [Myxococcales bacterium]
MNETIQSRGKLAVMLLGASAALPVVLRVLPSIPYAGMVATLLQFVGVIVFLMWLHATTRYLGTSVPTRFSPGMAVGGWFIPFANFVLPALSFGDVYKRSTGRSAGLVGLWWALYLVSTVLTGVSGTMGAQYAGSSGATVLMAVSWLNLIVHTGAFGLWAFLVKESTQPSVAGSAVTA